MIWLAEYKEMSAETASYLTFFAFFHTHFLRTYITYAFFVLLGNCWFEMRQ